MSRGESQPSGLTGSAKYGKKFADGIFQKIKLSKKKDGAGIHHS
jgi:hypothetical protein